MTKKFAETIKKLVDCGFSIEDAFKLATLEEGAAAKTPAKQEKSVPKKAAPAKQEAKPVTAKKAPAKQGKPEKKLTAKQAAREANLEAAKGLDALALITGAKWTVEAAKHSLTGEDVWVIKPVERFDKAAFYAVSKQFSEDLDGGYFRGGWTVRIDPTEYLATGKVGDVAAKRIADIKAARKAAREAKKAEAKKA